MTSRGLAAVVVSATFILGACAGGGTSDTAAGGDASPEPSMTEASRSGGQPQPSEESAAQPSPSTTGFADVLADGRISSAETCERYEAQIAKYQKEAVRRIGTAKGKAKDAYAAASFRKKFPWVKDSLTTKFNDAMDGAATRALNELSDGQAGVVDDFEAFLPAAVDACGLGAAYDKAEGKVIESDKLAQTIKTKANNKPWYPKGFTEYDFLGDLAYRWIDNAGVDCFSRCWYFTIEVISKDGCPSGVYGELSLEKNGTAIGWTNDSLSYLRPKQKGRMQFITYDDRAYGGSGTLAELRCY